MIFRDGKVTANIQVITMQDADGRYLPNYDELIASASCEDEIKKWTEAKERNFKPTWNMITCMKNTCGHWEIFQSPVNEHHPLAQEVRELYEHSQHSKCTRCICGW